MIKENIIIFIVLFILKNRIVNPEFFEIIVL